MLALPSAVGADVQQTPSRPGVHLIRSSQGPAPPTSPQSQASAPLSGSQTPAYYWYKPSGSADLWNTVTTPPTQQWANDTVGANYLPSHLLTNPGGVISDITASAPGDYCNSYNIGNLTTNNGDSGIGSLTGFSPPSPVSSYQVSTTPGSGYDSTNWAGSVCQGASYQDSQSTWQSKWGQWLNAADPSTTCNPNTVCGMHHAVPVAGTSDYPWSGAFNSPELRLSVTFDPSSYADFTSPTQGIIAWGYLCPILQDTSAGQGQTSRFLEVCLDEWQPADMGGTVWNKDYYFCNSFNDNGQLAYVDWAQTGFDGPKPPDPFVTLGSGWQTTTLNGAFGAKTYQAAITAQNLKNVVNDLNSLQCPLNGSVGVYSSNPASYRLVAVENGIESVGPLDHFGASESLLQVWTAYKR
jgi:hypothetical protein